MRLTYLLPVLLALGCVSGSALGAPNEHKQVNKERAKRIEHKRDERRKDKKHRIAHKKNKQIKRAYKKREQHKDRKRKIAHYKHDKRKYTYLKNRRHNVVTTYRPGRYFSNIPRNSASIRFNGISFTFSNGIYYRKAKRGYHVVKPPRGLRIRSLPKHYSNFKRHNTTYYTYQNVYYVADNNGYRVVDAPEVLVNKAVKVGNANNYELGQTYDTLPIEAEAVTVNEQQYFKYQDIYFLPQISGDEIKYLAVNLG